MPSRLATLRISASITEAGEIDGRVVFKDRAARTLSTNDAFVAAALRIMASGYPRSFLPAELSIAAAADMHGDPTEQQHAAVLDALFRMATIGMCDVGTTETRLSMCATSRPVALPIARADATLNQSWTTNIRHECVNLDLVQQAILPLLNGESDHAALLQRVRERVSSGHIHFVKNGERVCDVEDIEKLIGEHVRSALEVLKRQAVLVA